MSDAPPDRSRWERARAALAAAEAAAAAGTSSAPPDEQLGTDARSGSDERSGLEERSGPDGRPRRDARPRGSGRRATRRTAPQRGGQDAPTPDETDAAHEEARARQIVLRQLAMAPRSRAQLREKIVAKEIDPDVAESVLDRFADVGLVDDRAYSEALVRSQQASRGLARRGLSHELRKKGVDPDVAQAALDAVDDASERARAEELVRARLARMHGLDRTVQTRRLAGLLARKGYPAGLSFAVIREALDEAPEHRRD